MKVFEYFEQICKIPHCSFETDELREYLTQFAKKHKFEVATDEFGNIHAIKGEPKICLQAHYDMVCVGLAPNLELVNDGEFLSAKGSSLGSDNGIGVAIIMEMMSKFDNLEVLITNNEEVGLLGANGFNGTLKSKNILNLDSEDENGVFIGCASGVSIFASINLSKNEQICQVYEVEVSGLQGGHSGIEIIKNIPNAIKILAKFLAQNGCELVSLRGGERNNSIPVNAKAVVAGVNLSSNEMVKVKSLGEQKVKTLANSKQILAFINAFSQGVRSYDESVGVVLDSINLSIIKQDNDALEIEFFARSMSDEGREELKFQTLNLASLAGFKVRFEEETQAWKPVVSEFAKDILGEMKKINKDAKMVAVHAGLECGVLINRAKNSLQACSIGPNIYSPHSINEKCEIKSVEKISKVVENILKKYS
ncbi:aminoacyl-histidine dipeptidase [Campylobacter iguaniorum]|uniref:M20/M25/M40 family metallo-hydrolase n=1 Tax=Campylobacter iguaniorum TaxID=1244531 RepID=UPI0007C8B30E|nr:M20/M25/M40 family metallo-hydrolase [Campylobacter iguaniorum]ANE36096.1 aminoacyl-histidine dipeptidase [Campylobacter iguaniorum]